MSATCRWDCSHHWTFTPQPLIFAIWRVARCLPWGGVILYDGNSWKCYQRRSYPEVTSPIFIFTLAIKLYLFSLFSYHPIRIINCPIIKLLYQNQARNKITNYTSSWNSKLGEILISVVQFHLVHFCVQVPTWWWSKSPYGLIGNTGLCIDFINSGALFWVVSVDLFVVSATHKLAPSLLEFLRVGLSSNRRTVLGIIDCRHCHQLFLQWRLDFGI